MKDKQKYQAKAAAMPQQRVNTIVLTIAVVMALLAILAATIGAQAQAAQTGVLNWRVEWGVSEQQDSWWTHWYADSTPDRQVYTGVSFHYQASGSGITKTLTSAGTSSLYKADSNHVWTANSFWLSEGIGKDAYAGTAKNINCLPGPNLQMQRNFDTRTTTIRFTNTLGKSTSVTVNNNGQVTNQIVAAGQQVDYTLGQIGEVRVYKDETRGEVCGYMWINFDRIEPQPAPITLIIPNTSTVVGNEIMVPVAFRNNTGQMYSIDARLQYSPTHLAFVGIDQAGTLSSGFQYILNTNTPGSIIITGQGNTPITDNAGLMLRLKFRALRAGTVPVKLTGVQVPEVLINGGSIPVAGEYGQVTVNASLWTGAAYYWNRPLKDVVVTLTNGTDVVTTTTGWDGGYTAALPTLETWTATFNRETAQYDRNAVSSMDAALTHQYAAQLINLGDYAKLSADADGKQPITSYDANRILRYVARYVDNDAVCGKWRGENITAEVNGPTSSGHISKLWMMCDVSGNWLPDGTVRSAEATDTPSITTTVISVEPLVVRVSSDQPFSGLALQFDQDVQSVTATGFDTVQPNGGLVPLASMTAQVNTVDLTIVPVEGTEVLTLDSITVDELAPVGGPTIKLDPQDEMPILQLDIYLPAVMR